VVTTATPAPLVTMVPVDNFNHLRKNSASLYGKLTIRSKDYSVTTKGFYLKAASEFTSPFEDQTGNAGTMADPTNRLNFVADTEKRQSYFTRTFWFGVVKQPIDNIDYYASAYIEVNETGERFISDYVLVENSINATVVPPEIQSFQLAPPVLNSNRLSNSSDNYSSDTSKGISGTITWNKEANSGGVPKILNVGAYYITKSGASKPTSVTNFLNAYNGTEGQTGWTPSSKILNDDQMNFSADGKSATYTIPLPDNSFPSANTGKTFYAVGFIEYSNGNVKYSNTVEEFYMPPPPQAIATADTIYYNTNNGNVIAVRKNGVSTLTSEERDLAYHGSYNPLYIESVIDISAPWFIYIQIGGSVYTEKPFTAGGGYGQSNFNQGLAASTTGKGVGYAKVKKVGNTLRFSARSVGLNGKPLTTIPWVKYWIIKDYKKWSFLQALRNSRTATALLETYAETFIETIYVKDSPDGPPPY